MIRFKTAAEAARALDDLQAKKKGFCPIIRDICRKDCKAYYKGEFMEMASEDWGVYPPCCMSPLVTGEVYMDS